MQTIPSRHLLNKAAKPTVLVADDDPTSRLLMELMLAADGYQAVLAGDGREALSLLERHRVVGVVIGTLMMGVSGVELCRTLRARPDTQRLPILMLLSTNDANSIERCMAAGADDYLVKPVIAHQLTSQVRAMLRRS